MGETDDEGSVFFSVNWFDNSSTNPWVTLENPVNNMTDSLSVTALWRGGVSEEVSILSDTPIVIERDRRFRILPLIAALVGVILLVSIYKLRTRAPP